MKLVSKHFNQICSKRYMSFGFCRSKKTFVRVKKDIIQTFTLKGSQNLSTCSVEFGLFPLCMPQPIFLDAGGYMLDEFIVNIHAETSGWSFSPISRESKMRCAESITQAIDVHLLPFFDICCDCKVALPELLKLEELLDRNRQATLLLRGDTDSAAPWQERSLFDYKKYYMALKAHDYSYAKRYLDHQVSFYKTRLEAFDRASSPKQPAVVKERFTSKLAIHQEHFQQLESGNFDFFVNLLNINEVRMREFMVSTYPGITLD